jgi:hypothetical protein
MKSYIFLMPLLTLIAIPYIAHSAIDQNFQIQLNLLQNTLTTVIEQSNIDPETAQDLNNKINSLNQLAQSNMKQDAKDINAATALSCFLETGTGFLKNTSLAPQAQTLASFKYSARSNAIHKLIIGLYPGKFSDEAYYTDPYTETAGFTLNDWIFSSIFTAAFSLAKASDWGKALSLDTISDQTQTLALRVAAGVTAHYAWHLEKKALMPNSTEQTILKKATSFYN